MTTFEITIIVLLVIIAIAVIYGMLILKQTISYNQMVIRQKADNLENAWACDITSIIGSLRRLENCLTQDINWGELTDDQKNEILYRLTHPVVESPFKPPFNPTCETTNTSIKAEDAPLQEWFNDNKED